jgi:putative ABC transport system permease protein
VENLFGVSMTSIMYGLLIAFGLCLGVGFWILLRNRVIFRMGVRNIPRRPAQTVLIIIGLMLSTLIIAAALTTGDTLNYSIRSEVYDYLGQIDQTVVRGTDEEAAAGPQPGVTIPIAVLDDLRAAVAGEEAIDGVMGVVTAPVPAIHAENQMSEPVVVLTGLEPGALDAFGGLQDVDGNAIDLSTLAPGEAILSEKMADGLNAAPGDAFTIFVQNAARDLTVHSIAPDSYLTGVQAAGAPGGFAVPLAYAQELMAYETEVSFIAVTNRGGVTDGVQQTDAAMSVLESALAGAPFQAVAVKQSGLEEAELVGNLFSSLFVVLGLFSIAAGVLLIFLIFVLLAAERKPEMGMARAVGLKRRQLTQMYLAEGLAYDLGAALIGALLGVGVAFVMADVMARLIGDFIRIQPAASWQSLVIAYTLGVIVTFITIVISSWRISRLNIVAAIRDIPEPTPERESRRWLIFGVLGAIIGALMIWGGTESNSLALHSIGFTIVPFSIAAILRRFGVSPRLLYTLASAVVLVYWLMPFSWFERIFPGLEGDFEMFFVSGVMMVAAATVMIVWNAQILTGLISILGQRFSRWLPAVKTAVAYPLATRGRTGMTIAMFSLIIFSLVAMATINSNFEAIFTGDEAAAGWDIMAQQSPINPVEDFTGALAAGGVDTGNIEATGRISTMDWSQTQVRMPGAEEWSSYTVQGANEGFIRESHLPLQIRAEGYATDDEVWQAVLDNPNLAVVDGFAIFTEGFQVGGPEFRLEGVRQGEPMQPTVIEIAGTGNGGVREVTVIGVIDQRVSVVNGIFLSEPTFAEIYPEPTSFTYWVRARDGVDLTELANQIEQALIAHGVQAMSIPDLINEQIAINRGFIYLVEGFMALGLVVGIAALGVVSFRSVVERRQQIGMLRAIGYKRSMVAASFLIESTMITLLGVLSGAGLALWLSWQLMTSEEFAGVGDISFSIPWLLIGTFIGIALVASLLMAYIPARQASRVPIADALRYE